MEGRIHRLLFRSTFMYFMPGTANRLLNQLEQRFSTCPAFQAFHYDGNHHTLTRFHPYDQ